MSPLSCYFSFFLARLIAVASTVSTCLVCNSSIVVTCPSIPAARFAFRLFYSFCFSCSQLFYLANQSRSKGEGWSTTNYFKSRKETPQKLTQLSSRSHPRHLVGKRTTQKDITIDTTSDSQVNSKFPNRWSPASLTFNNYFYLFLYLNIT